MSLSFLGGLKNMPIGNNNKFNWGTVTGEFDNIWDIGNNMLSSSGTEEANVFSSVAKQNRSNPVKFFTDFIAALIGGEMIKEVDSLAGLAGSITKSVLLKPIDAITDFGSGIMVIARGAANGDLGVGTFFEAAQYIGSSIPVLGEAIDIVKFKKAYDKMSATGKQIKKLNKGLGSALGAAKANKTGKVLKFDDLLTTDLNKLQKSVDWNNLRELKVSVKNGDAIQEMKFTEALKQYRKGKPGEQLELKKTLENTIENYNVGAGKGSVFSNLEKAEVIKSHDNFVNWKGVRNNKIDVNGTKKSFDDLIKSTDPDEIKHAQEALKKYNKANGSDLNLDKLKSMKNGHDDWIEIEGDLTALRIKTDVGSGEVITFNEFGARVTKKKQEFKQQGQELINEAMKVADEYKQKAGVGMHGLGITTKSIKNFFTDTFSRGWGGQQLAAA